MILNVDKVYVMHYRPLTERLTHIDSHLKQHGIDYSLFDMEPEVDLQDYFINDFDLRKSKLSNFPGNLPKKEVKSSEISLAYKHVRALEDMVKNNAETALFLEDDAILCNDFSNLANHFVNSTPADWDMIFPGNGCNLRIDSRRLQQGKHSYKKSHPATKCTDSYFIKLSAAKKLISTIKPFNIAIDWELNYQLFLHDLSVYWFEPFLVQQGSTGAGTGIWQTAIQ
tara:strand:- start:119 stop:796 length:678 start_codon:yes stop_codon:yes gene_type:complete